jgi:hypothetical protein
MVADKRVSVFQVDVVQERVGLFGRKRVVLASAQFATHNEAYWWSRQFIGGDCAVELMDIGYIPHHPVETAYDDQQYLNQYIDIIRDYFGDEVNENNWEKYADEMDSIEAEKRKSIADAPF